VVYRRSAPAAASTPAPPPVLADKSSSPWADAPAAIDAPATLAATEPATPPMLAALALPTTRPAQVLETSSTPVIFVSGPTPASAPPTADILSAAKARADAGELAAARNMLNAALLGDQLSATDAIAARQALANINQTLIFSPRKFSDDPDQGAYLVKPGDRLSQIAAANGVTWEFLSRINGIEPRHLRSGQTIKIVTGPFHAVVNKSAFTMDIYLGAPGGKGSIYVTTFPVGLGKDNGTPTGLWQVEPKGKIRHPTYFSSRGEGVIDADDPKNPLGGYWIAIAGLEGQAVGKQSFGIHGTIDPDSIGKESSLGCIRLRHDDIALVFDLLVEAKSTIRVVD